MAIQLGHASAAFKGPGSGAGIAQRLGGRRGGFWQGVKDSALVEGGGSQRRLEANIGSVAVAFR